jgi:ParB-like chromosome segregation protein Spo0J
MKGNIKCKTSKGRSSKERNYMSNTIAAPGDGAKKNENPVAPVNGPANDSVIAPTVTQEERIGKHAVHPLASLFPLLKDDEYKALVDGIKVGGQQLPIIKDQNGLIVDGRNRLRALLDLGSEPKFETRVFENDDDLTRYLVNANITRRHLNAVQRAFVAVELQKTLRPQAAKNQAEGVPPNLAGRDTRDQAAAQCGVSHTYVDIARRANEVDPRIAQLAKDGKLTSMVNVERLTVLDPKDRAKAIEALATTTPAAAPAMKSTKKTSRKSVTRGSRSSRTSPNGKAPATNPVAPTVSQPAPVQPAPVTSNSPEPAPVEPDSPEPPTREQLIDDMFTNAIDLCSRVVVLVPKTMQGEFVEQYLHKEYGFERDSVVKAIDFLTTLRNIGDKLKWFAPVA